MTSTCFEPNGLSAEDSFIYMQLQYGMCYIHKVLDLIIEQVLLPTRLLLLTHAKRTVPQMYIQPPSWRWTLGLETCRRHQN